MNRLRTILLVALLTAVVTPALAVDSIRSTDAPDLSAVRAKIAAKDFQGSIADLYALIDSGVQHADVYNLLGYSLRRSGDTKTALTFYKKALEFDPNHKGALEYSGELYVQIGDLTRARESAVRLAELCPLGCEELEDLRRAIAEATAKTN